MIPEWAWQIAFGPWDIMLKKGADGSVVTLAGPADISQSEWRLQNTPGHAWPAVLLSEQLANWVGRPKNRQRKTDRHKVLEPYLPTLEEYPPELSFRMDEQV